MLAGMEAEKTEEVRSLSSGWKDSGSISFQGGALTKSSVLGGLRQQKFIVQVLEARSPKCGQSHTSSVICREEPILASPSFWGLLEFLGIPWLTGAYLHMAVSSLCIYPILLGTPVMLGQGPTRFQHDLVLTNTSAMTLFPNRVTVEVLGFRTSRLLTGVHTQFLTVQPPTPQINILPS